ncbi:MAG: hypothetical protein HYW49_11820 [Deltaproteobacteria bacterium]|nr:hypothetical protein [Deltaproteobacteria bacterium]
MKPHALKVSLYATLFGVFALALPASAGADAFGSNCRIALHVDSDFTRDQASTMEAALVKKGYDVRMTNSHSDDPKEFSGYIGMDHGWDLFHRYASIDISRPGESLYKEYLPVTTGIFWNRATRKIVKALEKNVPECCEPIAGTYVLEEGGCSDGANQKNMLFLEHDGGTIAIPQGERVSISGSTCGKISFSIGGQIDLRAAAHDKHVTVTTTKIPGGIHYERVTERHLSIWNDYRYCPLCGATPLPDHIAHVSGYHSLKLKFQKDGLLVEQFVRNSVEAVRGKDFHGISEIQCVMKKVDDK